MPITLDPPRVPRLPRRSGERRRERATWASEATPKSHRDRSWRSDVLGQSWRESVVRPLGTRLALHEHVGLNTFTADTQIQLARSVTGQQPPRPPRRGDLTRASSRAEPTWRTIRRRPSTDSAIWSCAWSHPASVDHISLARLQKYE